MNMNSNTIFKYFLLVSISILCGSHSLKSLSWRNKTKLVRLHWIIRSAYKWIPNSSFIRSLCSWSKNCLCSSLMRSMSGVKFGYLVEMQTNRKWKWMFSGCVVHLNCPVSLSQNWRMSLQTIMIYRLADSQAGWECASHNHVADPHGCPIPFESKPSAINRG